MLTTELCYGIIFQITSENLELHSLTKAFQKQLFVRWKQSLPRPNPLNDEYSFGDTLYLECPRAQSLGLLVIVLFNGYLFNVLAFSSRHCYRTQEQIALVIKMSESYSGLFQPIVRNH